MFFAFFSVVSSSCGQLNNTALVCVDTAYSYFLKDIVVSSLRKQQKAPAVAVIFLDAGETVLRKRLRNKLPQRFSKQQKTTERALIIYSPSVKHCFPLNSR